MSVKENALGVATPGQPLKYSPLTSCLTVTALGNDGTLIGAHAVLSPFGLAALLEAMKEELSERGLTIRELVLVVVECWDTRDNFSPVIEGSAAYWMGYYKNYEQNLAKELKTHEAETVVGKHLGYTQPVRAKWTKGGKVVGDKVRFERKGTNEVEVKVNGVLVFTLKH